MLYAKNSSETETSRVSRPRKVTKRKIGYEERMIPCGAIELAATIVRPAKADLLGAIVFVHGFGGERTEKGLFQALAGRAAAQGFAAVLYDWRGVGGSESAGDFANTSLRDHVNDFQHLTNWVGTTLCPNSVMHAVGFSLGAAVIGLAQPCHKLFESLTYLSPAVRPKLSMYPRYDTPAVWESIQKRGYVEKEGSSVLIGRPILESLRDTDLGQCAFALPVPLFVYQGANDERIRSVDTRHTLLASLACGATVKYQEFPGATHSFRPANKHWSLLGDSFCEWLVSSAKSEPSEQGSSEWLSPTRSRTR